MMAPNRRRFPEHCAWLAAGVAAVAQPARLHLGDERQSDFAREPPYRRLEPLDSCRCYRLCAAAVGYLLARPGHDRPRRE